jgi:hypothetical protein
MKASTLSGAPVGAVIVLGVVSSFALTWTVMSLLQSINLCNIVVALVQVVVLAVVITEMRGRHGRRTPGVRARETHK